MSHMTGPAMPCVPGRVIREVAHGIVHMKIWCDRQYSGWEVGCCWMALSLSDPATIPRNLGLVYERISKALPRHMNGKPMFMSCSMINKHDASRVWRWCRWYAFWADCRAEGFRLTVRKAARVFAYRLLRLPWR